MAEWGEFKPFETEVDETEWNGANENTEHDSNDHRDHETFNTHTHIQLYTVKNIRRSTNISWRVFSARCNIYISHLCHDASPSVRLSVCLSVTEVHWRIIVNLGFKFRSHFTDRALAAVLLAGTVLLAARRAACGESSRAMLASARLSCPYSNGTGSVNRRNNDARAYITVTPGSIPGPTLGKARIPRRRHGHRHQFRLARHAYILTSDMRDFIARILARKSVSVSWNASLTSTGDLYFLPCLLYTSPSPRDRQKSRMPSSA